MNADGVRIAQVLTNLLANAVNFTPRGGKATVTVSSSEIDGAAVLSVTDTGSGIDPELLPRLFEPFMQADRPAARSGGGLGLGLALVKGLVELHGGSVSARSAGRDMGAEFIVRLPLDDPAVVSPRAPAVVHSPLRGRRLLVIEDDEDVAAAMRVVLQMVGHEVSLARTGADGIAAARASRPEVVLCDIGLPGMDGYEVARRIPRGRVAARDLPGGAVRLRAGRRRRGGARGRFRCAPGEARQPGEGAADPASRAEPAGPDRPARRLRAAVVDDAVAVVVDLVAADLRRARVDRAHVVAAVVCTR